jgi:Pyruvate/2-oxoacid:ferredoxin oxidoreductase gamma subunit
MLGAFTTATNLFELEALIEQVQAWFGKKISAQAVEANVRALRRAAQEIQEG